MNKVYLVVSVITMVVTCYLATSQNETKLPKKIENLPIGIEVRHNLEQVYATFNEDYPTRGGVLKKGQIYTDTNNWGTSNKIEDIETKTLWYFIGTNSEGEKFVGFSGIKMIGELKNK